MSGIKEYIKRKVRNLVGATEIMQKHDTLLEVYCALLQEAKAMQQKLTNALQEKYTASQQERRDLQDTIAGLLQEKYTASQQKRQAAQQEIVRNQIFARWRILDAIEPLVYSPDQEICCRICGHSAPLKTFEKKVSFCIFNGGRLERYVCPQCGCIFGPLKMYLMPPEELNAEYHQHYSVFSEGNSLESELAAFEQVDQGKENKIYLNFGAGIWSGTSKLLREQGYTVYDYEPGVNASSNEYFITNKVDLEKYRFDGIFSNDLIEHLYDPIQELTFMKTLLAAPTAKMAHATGCFDYAYEYTRFHLFFYTGNSLECLAKKLGMKYKMIRMESHLNTHFKIAIFSSNDFPDMANNKFKKH